MMCILNKNDRKINANKKKNLCKCYTKQLSTEFCYVDLSVLFALCGVCAVSKLWKRFPDFQVSHLIHLIFL